MNREEIIRQYSRYLEGELPASEAQALLEALALPENQELTESLLSDSFERQTGDQQLSAESEARILAHIFQKKQRSLWPRIAAAASLVIALSAGGYLLLHQQQPTSQQTASNIKHDIAPGGNRAILTLSNGQQIVLDNETGQIASQAGRAVKIGPRGQVSYSGQANQSNQSGNSETMYNTLTVPTGNARDITLPDGTQVSLDAGSSITYPVTFQNERRVAMTGQAYFSVKHDPKHPFFTTVKGVTIADIGTEFNVNAYDDEAAVKTTLVQGSVQVNEMTIKPGEQALVADGKAIIRPVDIDVETAWKKNDFYFDHETLKNAMRQIARWYNVKVVYNHVDEKLKLFVDVTRATNLSVVLKAIENTGKVKCRLEGHTIILSPPN